MTNMRGILIWAVVAALLVIPIIFSANSPQLVWRDPVYIAAGFAGVLGLALLLVQPVLALGILPQPNPRMTRKIHRSSGFLLLFCVVVHIATLAITSPPDVRDALLFNSPTPFSLWGVIAMWAVLATALLATFRRHIALSRWRLAHRALAVVIVGATVLHALLIDGTMESWSKAALCGAVIAATLWAVITKTLWKRA